MKSDNVRTLRDVLLTDIPGMLRKTADMIEAGILPNPTSCLLVCIEKAGIGDTLALSSFGEALNTYEVVGILEMAKAEMVGGSDG